MRWPATPTASTARRKSPAPCWPPTRWRAPGRWACKPQDDLANNDGHGFFGALGDSVVTGPTLTNVNDFRAILIEAASTTREISMRRTRNAKIVATLGPASSEPRNRTQPVHGRGRCVPAQLQPRQRRRPPGALQRCCANSSRRSGARSASWPTCKAPSCAWALLPTAR